jgi:hypothetical protein
MESDLNPLRIKNIMPDHEASYITGPARNATPSCRYVLFNAGITLVSERTATARYAKFHHVFKKKIGVRIARCCFVAALPQCRGTRLHFWIQCVVNHQSWNAIFARYQKCILCTTRVLRSAIFCSDRPRYRSRDLR